MWRKIWDCLLCRILLILATIATGLFLAAILLINPLLNLFVKTDLEERINSQQGHRINIDALSFSFFTNTISSSGITYSFKDKDININAVVPEISIGGIPWVALIQGSSLSFSEVTLNEPDIRIQNLTAKKDEPRKNIIEQLRDIIPPDQKPLKVGELNIYGGRFRNRKHNSEADDIIKNINFSAVEIFIHNEKESEQIPLELANSVSFRSGTLLWNFPEKKYELKIDSIDFSSLDSTLAVGNFSFYSDETPLEFFKGRKFRSNKLNIRLKNLTAEGIDLPDLITENIISSGVVEVSGAFLEFLTDKRVLRDPSIIPKMPHELIASIDYKLDVKKLSMRDSEIHIKELWSDNLISHLPFTKLRADISNLSSYAGTKYPVKFNISAHLADAGEIKVIMKLPLKTDILRFEYEGSLGKMNVLSLNPHLKVADKSELTSGDIVSAAFTVVSQGSLTKAGIVPIYNGLKVKTLTAKSTEGGAFQDIKTFFANTFTIRESNPDKEGKIKSGNIIYTKEKSDYFLDIVWFSLRDALGEVVGF